MSCKMRFIYTYIFICNCTFSWNVVFTLSIIKIGALCGIISIIPLISNIFISFLILALNLISHSQYYSGTFQCNGAGMINFSCVLLLDAQWNVQTLSKTNRAVKCGRIYIVRIMSYKIILF